MRRATALAVAALTVVGLSLASGCTVSPDPGLSLEPSAAAQRTDASLQQVPADEADPAAGDATLAPISAPSPTASPSALEPNVQVELIETTPPPGEAGSGVSGGSGGAGGSGKTGTPNASVMEASATYAQQLVALANEARADAGLPALSISSCARSAAKARAGRALAKSQLEHEPLDFNCDRSWAGENLARHPGSAPAMHRAWMDSPGHRENILRPEFTRIGVGCVAYSRSDRQKVPTSARDVGGQVCAQVFFG